jgi:hypothetical protein
MKPFQNISNLIISHTNQGSGCQTRKDLMTHTEGYGILAQLCPEGEEGQQQEQALSNVSTTTTFSSSSYQQQQGQEEIIHIYDILT